MPSMAAHDLRRRVQQLSDLRRRYEAHEKLSTEDMALLHKGIPAEEMREIVDSIRMERRSATPSKKTTKAEQKREAAQPVSPMDLNEFLTQEHEIK